MRRPADPKVVSRLKRSREEVNFAPACRVRGKQTGLDLLEKHGPIDSDVRPVRAWISSPTIAPEDLFAIMSRRSHTRRHASGWIQCTMLV